MTITIGSIPAPTFSAAASSTTATCTFPAAIAAGDLLVLCITVHPSTATIGTPAGWTALSNVVSANGAAQGADTGDCRVATFYMVAADGSLAGTTFTFGIGGTTGTAGNCTSARIVRVIKTNAGSWDVNSGQGSDNTANTTWAATMAVAQSVQTGDVVLAFLAMPTDTMATFTGEAFSATGYTFSAVTTSGNLGSTNGLDGGVRASYASVASGSGTATVQWSAALSVSTNQYGPAAFVIIREPAGGSSTTITSATSTFSAPSVSAAPGPVTTSITPATGTFSAQAVTPAGAGPATATLTPATATFSAPSTTQTPGPVTTAATAAVAAFSAPSVTPTPGPVNVTAQPATAVFSARPVTPSGAVVLTPATATFSSGSVTPQGAGAVTITPAQATFSARPVTATPGPVATAVAPATAVFSVATVTPTPGPVTVTLVPATAVFSARPVVPAGIGPGLTAITPATATWSARPVAVPGLVALVPATTVFSAPAVVAETAAVKPMPAFTDGDRPAAVTYGPNDRAPATVGGVLAGVDRLRGVDRPAANLGS